MQTTKNLGLRKPEENEFYNVNDYNHNSDVVDALFEKDENDSVVAKNAKQLDGHGAEYFATAEQMGMGNRLSTSILEKALTLGAGVYNFSLDRGNYTGNDLPHKYYAYGMASVYRSTTIKGTTVILWSGQYKLPIAVNMHDGTSWFGWATLAEEKNYASLLPPTVEIPSGADLNTYLTVGTFGIGSATIALSLLNKPSTLAHGGKLVVENTQNANNFYQTIYSVDGVFRRYVSNGTFYNWEAIITTAGATFTAETTPLQLVSTNTTDDTRLKFTGAGGLLGWLAFIGANNPVFRHTDGVNYQLLHTGNKPTGTYNGNGSATERIISAGNAQMMYILFQTGDSNSHVIVDQIGYFGVLNGEFVKGNEIKAVADGISISSATVFNASGVGYRYRSL